MDITFPYYINFFGLPIHAHMFFEYLAFFIGYRVYSMTRNKKELTGDKSIGVFISATIGGYLGAIILASFEHYDLVLEGIETSKLALIQGKTIVGALLGGLIAIELYKKAIGYTKSTGDDIAIPLTIAIMIGRIGCFLTGVEDSTIGRETSSIFGFDFGDGIPRLPLPLFEIAFLLIILIALINLKKFNIWNGFKFQFFMTCYLSYRFFNEFFKDRATIIFNLSAIQIACVLGLIYYAQLIYKRYKEHKRR